MAKEDKLKALDAAIAQIEKQYGKGSVMKLGDNSANMNVETVPTGSLSLDIALGLGGREEERSRCHGEADRKCTDGRGCPDDA